MYLHIGNEVILSTDEIIGIFDLDKASQSKITRKFLSDAQKRGDVVNTGEDLPKSFILCKKENGTCVYLSQLNTSTLLGRSRAGFVGDFQQ